MTRLNPLHDHTVNRFLKKFDHVDCLPCRSRLDPTLSSASLSTEFSINRQILLCQLKERIPLHPFYRSVLIH